MVKITDVSEEFAASFFMIEVILKEKADSSETLVILTRCYIPRLLH
jgi:hypothetical protein